MFKQLAIVLVAGLMSVNATLSEPEIGKCTEEERSIWIGNSDFTKNFQTCSTRGIGVVSAVAACLSSLYPTLSEPCSTCLGQSSKCAASNCLVECISNPGSVSCRTCFVSNCYPALLACTGAVDDSQLPVPPEDTSLLPVTPVKPRIRKTRTVA